MSSQPTSSSRQHLQQQARATLAQAEEDAFASTLGFILASCKERYAHLGLFDKCTEQQFIDALRPHIRHESRPPTIR